MFRLFRSVWVTAALIFRPGEMLCKRVSLCNPLMCAFFFLSKRGQGHQIRCLWQIGVFLSNRKMIFRPYVLAFKGLRIQGIRCFTQDFHWFLMLRLSLQSISHLFDDACGSQVMSQRGSGQNFLEIFQTSHEALTTVGFNDCVVYKEWCLPCCFTRNAYNVADNERPESIHNWMRAELRPK